MRIWRITASRHIDTVFSGIGGLYASGRWHPQGYKISYTSESLALASLEVFVHLEAIDIPLACVSAIVPESTPILEMKDLPSDWQNVSAYPILQEIGRKWLRAMEYPVLKVPSAIIPVEFNYLINPEHPDLNLEVERVLMFEFDRRMWKNKS
jgi:RES domain-containing protein